MKPIEELTGVELDAAVASEVLGWEVVHNDDASIMAWHPNGSPAECIRGPRGDTCGCWMPSTNIADAWRVIDWIQEKIVVPRSWAILSIERPGFGDEEWMVGLRYGHVYHAEPMGRVQALTLPLAICRFALSVGRASGLTEKL